MINHIRQLIDSILCLRSSKLLDNLSDAEVRRNTTQFLSILTMFGIVMMLMELFDDEFQYAQILINIWWIGVYIVSISTVYLINLNKNWCLRLSFIVVLFEGVIAVVRWIVYQVPSPGDVTVIGVMSGFILGAFFLPWSPRQTIILSALWIMCSISSLFITEQNDDFSFPASIVVYVLITFPGIMISFFKMSRFQDQLDLHFLKTKYEVVRNEIQAAKNIHERAFPKPKSSGEIRFLYSYQPMSQIGGDSIFALTHQPGVPESPVTIVLFDVTGHGLSAALTANRLQGELMRLTGEQPNMDPGELLVRLDRYINLTLADTALLVSAVAMYADPRSSLIRIANAGHPSAILRNARGGIDKISSSCPVLGVGVNGQVHPAVVEYPFHSGDSLVAYTDGVSESVNSKGNQFNEQGVIDVLDGDWLDQSERWPKKILSEVEKRRAGNAADDILIVELYRA